MTLTDLTNKYAVITGAAGLLGIEHAKALLECSCNVILTDIDSTGLTHLAAKLSALYPEVSIIPYTMDVTSESSVISLRDFLDSQSISIDILINNAAINPKVDPSSPLTHSTRLENFSLEQWNLEISVGLTGAFLCSKILGYSMINNKSGGVIINIASDLSVIAPDQRLYELPNTPSDKQPVKPVTYSVIKSALIGLTKYLSTYWCNHNIRCNALSPGGVFTNQDDTFVQNLNSLIPLNRMASIDEYHGAIQFLCSDSSKYMTGQNLVVDGGRTVW